MSSVCTKISTLSLSPLSMSWSWLGEGREGRGGTLTQDLTGITPLPGKDLATETGVPSPLPGKTWNQRLGRDLEPETWVPPSPISSWWTDKVETIPSLVVFYIVYVLSECHFCVCETTNDAVSSINHLQWV